MSSTIDISTENAQQVKTSDTPRLNGLPSASEVKRAYFSGFPGAGQQSLDQSTVAAVLGWLNKARVVGTDKDNFWRRGRDFYLVIELQGGDRLVVRLAEDCVVTQTADSTRTTCNYAEGHVNLIALESEAPRLRAPELADWLKGQAAQPAPPMTPTSSGDPGTVAGERTEDREHIEDTIRAGFAALADGRKGWRKYPADNPEAKKNLDLIERKLSVLEQIQRDYIEGNKPINALMKELEDLPKIR
jgi:hypothetical protein